MPTTRYTYVYPPNFVPDLKYAMVETRGSSCTKVQKYRRGGRVPGPVKKHDRSKPNKTCQRAKEPELKRRGKAYKSSNPDSRR